MFHHVCLVDESRPEFGLLLLYVTFMDNDGRDLELDLPSIDVSLTCVSLDELSDI